MHHSTLEDIYIRGIINRLIQIINCKLNRYETELFLYSPLTGDALFPRLRTAKCGKTADGNDQAMHGAV